MPNSFHVAGTCTQGGAARIEGINQAGLTRQIHTIQMRLLDLAKAKTQALAAARHIDLQASVPSTNRLAKAK
ncbi:hypothetical protein [Mycobacterium shinjukuense]|uniref:Uncharacterized protein n=1 Tax=Mycobacterium shinjukuense TaxID=398694 RepID=A0A7I7MQ53_9MYCO|nr:hypothetical protein [Mycobacterium shinjukuense]BBX74401.1 hypothetical protein MSHI_23070 [Mycobacterium shinjukuense]